jgi:hypothetical protein
MDQTYAWLAFYLRSVRAGNLPIWDPYSLSGNIYVGEMNTGVFYPGKLLFSLLAFGSVDPTAYNAYQIYFVITHIFACMTMYWFIREIGLSFFSGIIAGMAFGFAGLVGNIGTWPHHYDGATWIPMALLFTWRALKSEQTSIRIRNGAIAGLFVALSLLAGSLYVVFVDAIAIVGLVSTYGAPWQNTNANKRNQAMIGRVVLMSVIFGVAILGSAVQMWPSAEYSPRAYRWLGIPSTAVFSEERPPFALIKFGLFPYHPLSFLMPVEFEGRLGNSEVLRAYLSVAIVILAGIGIWKAWDKFWVRYSVLLGIFAYLISLVPVTNVYGFLYSVVPFVWMAREASRFLFLVDVSLVILAAYGIECLFSASFDTSSFDGALKVLKWSSISALFFLAVPATFSKIEINLWNAWSLVIIAASGLLFRYLLQHRLATSTKVALVLFMLVDLQSFDWQAYNMMDAKTQNIDYLAKMQAFQGAAEFIKKQPGPFRVRLDVNPQMNIGPVYGIETLNGRGSSVLRLYLPFLGYGDFMNVRYLIKPAAATDPNPLYQDASYKVYENPTGFPRAWLVHQSQVVPDPETALNQSASQMANRTVGPREIALVGTSIGDLDANADRSADKVEITNYDPVHPKVTVQTAARSLVIFSENFYPGWKATVNGVTQPIIQTDGNFRGVVVPAGRSEIVLKYRPMSMIVGGIFSAITFIAVGYWVFVSGRRRGGESLA